MSRPRIAVRCSEEHPERRHRWLWRETHHRAPEGFVWDKWCQRCGIWWIDAIEHTS